VRLVVPQSDAGFPADLYDAPARNRALCDYLTRELAACCEERSSRTGTGGGGVISVDRPGQEVLERTSVNVSDREVEARITVGLPAAGRRVLGRKAATILLDRLPEIVLQALVFESLDERAVRCHADVVEDQHWLRGQLAARGLVAFVGDGALLPRRSGVDPRPMGKGAVPFRSPPSLATDFTLPNGGRVTGAGIPEGVTLIVGGGYHGKSTLLSAIELGVYDHPPDDGRELVVTVPDAVKIRAEDGRAIRGVDISPFIDGLPFGKDTSDFSTDDASGSTSQAANIAEALEYGTSLLLIDEDTSATNFMIRDHRMQELVAVVVGGVGDYFDVADTVIMMDSYEPADVTDRATAIARKYAAERTAEGGDAFGRVTPRAPQPGSLDPRRGKRPEKVDAKGRSTILFGRTAIDLSAVEQLVSVSQTRAIGDALVLAKKRFMDGERTVSEVLDALEGELDRGGLDALSRFPTGSYARPRRQEIAQALNRLRTIAVRQVR
jgi:predicted ABC-class ATPase